MWCHPEGGAPDLADGHDYFRSVATYPKALAFARRTKEAEQPLALVRQREYIDEPERGVFVHVKKARVAEWRVEWLSRPRRTKTTIPCFFAPDAPSNRLDILRGIAKPARQKLR